jgi:nicotinate-nucleotide--dimethylbenzimidazole phosphoribosyltransferase
MSNSTKITFTRLDHVRKAMRNMPLSDAASVAGARERNAQLTKPPGALGRLEDLAIWYAGWRGNERPMVQAPQVIVFAGNHGVAARNVSAFPPAVTEQMVMNFQHGGAAINQLARTFGAKMDVHALSLESPTADFTQAHAMTEIEVCSAIQTGWDAVDSNADLLVAGEMGIGNTTSAAAIGMALLGGDAADWTGRGTGVEGTALHAKTEVVAAGVALHAGKGDGLDALMALGGRELAAMAGAILRARALSIPVILDGFICTAAATCLHATQNGILDHAIAGHQSDEQAHERMLSALGKKPLLQLGLRLGEASGGALAIGILQGAVACHSGMSTFAEAGVSEG